MHRSPIKAAVALGSNLGDRAETLTGAVCELEARGFLALAVSSFFETEPVDCVAGTPKFLNAAAIFSVSSEISAEKFLGELLSVEKKFGRERPFKNAPRTLDLDLIFFGREKRASAGLTLPHPRWRERAFVTEPLAEIFSALPGGVPVEFREFFA